MQAFSIRQLKSNPSTVLRAAEADAMALVTSHQQPTALVVALDRLGVPGTVAVRSGLALSLFRAGSISVASAAQVAGLPLPRFLEILSSLQIPVVEGDAAELQEDLANARLWLNGAP
jgi:antitoxin (DNA-binding transcriptional repressor) of toxin-antitoxin stability system